MAKTQKENTNTVHFRLSEKDIAILDCCAKLHGFSRSAYVRDVILSCITSEMADMSINYTEKIIRETMETILDIKLKREAHTLRSLIGEIQRANFMQLKNYIEKHPGLDLSEYRAFYYQSDKEAFELSSGKKDLSAILRSANIEKQIPDWLKMLSGDNGEE